MIKKKMDMKNIKYTLWVVVIALFVTTGCITEDIVDITPQRGLQFNLSIPNSTVVESRADGAAIDPECYVVNGYVCGFSSYTPDKKIKFWYELKPTDIVGNGNRNFKINVLKDFVPSLRYYVFLNAKAKVNWETVKEADLLTTFTLMNAFSAGSDGSEIGYEMPYMKVEGAESGGLPMFAYADAGTGTGKTIDLTLKRSVAKIEVLLDSTNLATNDVTGTFKKENVTFEFININENGLFYTPDDTKFIDGNITEPQQVSNVGDPVATARYIHTSNYAKRLVDGSPIDSSKFDLNRMAIILKQNAEGANPLYYRIDFCTVDTLTNAFKFLDATENTNYKIKISKVLTAGYSSLEEAARFPGSNLAYDIVVDKNVGAGSETISNGQYALSVGYVDKINKLYMRKSEIKNYENPDSKATTSKRLNIKVDNLDLLGELDPEHPSVPKIKLTTSFTPAGTDAHSLTVYSVKEGDKLSPYPTHSYVPSSDSITAINILIYGQGKGTVTTVVEFGNLRHESSFDVDISDRILDAYTEYFELDGSVVTPVDGGLSEISFANIDGPKIRVAVPENIIPISWKLYNTETRKYGVAANGSNVNAIPVFEKRSFNQIVVNNEGIGTKFEIEQAAPFYMGRCGSPMPGFTPTADVGRWLTGTAKDVPMRKRAIIHAFRVPPVEPDNVRRTVPSSALDGLLNMNKYLDGTFSSPSNLAMLACSKFAAPQDIADKRATWYLPAIDQLTRIWLVHSVTGNYAWRAPKSPTDFEISRHASSTTTTPDDGRIYCVAFYPHPNDGYLGLESILTSTAVRCMRDLD